MQKICGNCRSRIGSAPGCEHDRAVKPNINEPCPFKPSKWEP